MTSEAQVDGLSIGEMSAASGLSIDTLRYYERIGLIAPTPRSSSGHRRYSLQTVERVESLGYLRAAGLSMDDMRTYLRNLDRGETAAADHAALLFAHAERIGRQIDELRVRQAYIAAKAGYWQSVADGEAETPAAQQSLDRARELAHRLRASEVAE